MFKSLLRTLPTLNGNFTLSCNIDNIYKDSSSEYYTYIKTADILPLQNTMFRKYFNISLLNGRYEYDVSKFYYLYSNVFYSENYSYLKNAYNTLDLTSNYIVNDARNKDYEFGCKRIQYSQYGYQFNFYAPFYINNVNDLPEYFNINIHLNDHLIKKLKVYINKKDNENYLKHYLEKYIKQIDDRVIFLLHETKQATYYGIDVKDGGLKISKDNVIGGIYDNQYTINNFDYTICQGFERNKLIMKQIIPLSFSFNLNDIFNNYERDFFKFAKIKITGNYVNKLGIEYDFYDFNIDYYEFYNSYNRYDSNLGKFIFANGEDENGLINIQNVSYPSLNEGMHTRYRFSNKMTPIYCRFKMLLSDDNDPYITNLSYGFSYSQYPSLKYGYFPTTFKNITPKLVISNNDLKLPIGKNKIDYYVIKQLRNNSPYINTDNLDKFNQLIRNYCSSWYNEWKQSYESIDDIINDHIWTDVRYNYAYLNGVLYNFNNSLQKDKIDKFTVLLDINLNKKTIEEVNNNIKKANIVLSYSDDSGVLTYDYDRLYSENKIFTHNGFNYTYETTLYNNYNLIKKAYIDYNICMEKDNYGSYVKVNNYNKINNYYKYEDLERIFLNNEILKDNIELLKSNQLTGYILLDGINNANYFETYKDIYKNIKTRLILYDDVFNTNSLYSMYSWLGKKLYMSTIRSTKKITVKSVYDTISDDENSYGKIAFYLREDLVDINRLITSLIDNNVSNESIRYFIKNLNSLNASYLYIPYSNDNGIQLENYFIKKKDYVKSIYVDTYNLNKYIKEYNRLYNSNLLTINTDNYNKEEFFVNIINKDHLSVYIKDMSKNENGVSTILTQNVFDIIYAKERIWNINDKEMKCIDLYIPLSKIMELKYKDVYNELQETTNIEKIKWLLKHISESRNQHNNFEFKCINKNNKLIKFELNLCFKKEFIKLDGNLMTLLNNDQYLYLYIKDECKSTNVDNWCIYNDQQLSKLDSSIYIKDINEFLMPLFTQPYMNDYDVRKLNKIIEGNKIQDYTIKDYDEICFKEIDLLTSTETLISKYYTNEFENLFRKYRNEFINSYIVKYNLSEEDNDNLQYQLDFLKESYKEVFYIDVIKNLCGIQLYSKYDILNISYNMNINKCVYDEDSKLNIYEKDGIRYGFYTISLNIDNTNNSFYIEDDYGMNMVFDTINGLELNDLTIMNNFRILYQSLKINIFNNFANDILLVVFPSENNIKIRYASLEVPKDEEYKYINLKKEETDIVYNSIKILKKERNIKLLRYFNYIEPCIQKVSYIRNAWEHKFKTKDVLFNIENNILNRTSLNIYKYNPLYVCTSFDKTTNKETYEYVSQLEYKHFNDNVLYNLDEEIIINEQNLVTYEKTLELQTDENIFNIFKKYIVLKHNNEDLILFLFNKYKVDFESVSDKLTTNKSNKLYKVTYKFTLI